MLGGQPARPAGSFGQRRWLAAFVATALRGSAFSAPHLGTALLLPPIGFNSRDFRASRVRPGASVSSRLRWFRRSTSKARPNPAPGCDRSQALPYDPDGCLGALAALWLLVPPDRRIAALSFGMLRCDLALSHLLFVAGRICNKRGLRGLAERPHAASCSGCNWCCWSSSLFVAPAPHNVCRSPAVFICRQWSVEPQARVATCDLPRGHSASSSISPPTGASAARSMKRQFDRSAGGPRRVQESRMSCKCLQETGPTATRRSLGSSKAAAGPGCRSTSGMRPAKIRRSCRRCSPRRCSFPALRR